jgi:hypothetical protein
VSTQSLLQPSSQQPLVGSQLSPGQSQISTTDQEKVFLFNYWFKHFFYRIFLFSKAALIMQVLQLRDDQIAMLPPEQRQSILVLKEQIAQRTGGMLP